MPRPKKKQKLTGDDINYLVEVTASADDLSVDVLANIFAFLYGPKEIMQKRRVCKKWKEAVKKALIPLTDFIVCNEQKFNIMDTMAREMPNLQRITLGPLGDEHKYNDGEDSNEERAAATADYTTHDIEIISNFGKLRDLTIYNVHGGLNGRYPFLFNSFPLLQKLTIKYCNYVKWDLGMLAGMPLLKHLECFGSNYLTGNINILRLLKDTLEALKIDSSYRVEGNFMDLADFPHLKELDLGGTAVTGDIRDIGESDFSSLKKLDLPKGVYGGSGYEFQSISGGRDLVRAVYLLKKQRPDLLMLKCKYWRLSEHSPDAYVSVANDGDTPPFDVTFVQAGPRIGYQWETMGNNLCEVNWLDPEPDRESSDYEEYIEELQKIESRFRYYGYYRGFYQPPTQEEYISLWAE